MEIYSKHSTAEKIKLRGRSEAIVPTEETEAALEVKKGPILDLQWAAVLRERGCGNNKGYQYWI